MLKNQSKLVLGFLVLTLALVAGCSSSESNPEEKKGGAPVVNIDSISVDDCHFYEREDVDRYIEMANPPCLKKALEDGISGDSTHTDGFFGDKKILLALALSDSALFFAKNNQYGHAAVVALLLKYGGNANRKFEDGTTFLERALRISAEHEPITLYVLHYAATDVNLTSNGGTPLEIAIDVKRENLIDALLSRSATVNTFTKSSSLPHQALENDLFVSAKNLINAGADVNAKNPAGASLAQRAIAKEQREVFDALTAKGAVLSTKMNGGETPLMTSIGANDAYFFNRLVDSGVDLSATDDDGRSALYFAVSANRGDRARTLLGKNVKTGGVTIAEENTLMHVVHDVSLAGDLAKKGVRIDEPNASRHTPLSQAVSNSRADLAGYFLSAGASETWVDRSGRSLLHVAVGRDSFETAKVVLAAGVKTSVEDQYGQEPIFEVASVPMFNLLMGHEASAISQDDRENHAFTRVLRNHPRRLDLVNAFVDKGAHPDNDLQRGFFPLHYAIELPISDGEKILLVQTLLRGKANPLTVDTTRRAPIHLVRNLDLLKELKKGGAQLTQTDKFDRMLRQILEAEMGEAKKKIETAVATGKEDEIAKVKALYQPIITNREALIAYLLGEGA